MQFYPTAEKRIFCQGAGAGRSRVLLAPWSRSPSKKNTRSRSRLGKKSGAGAAKKFASSPALGEREENTIKGNANRCMAGKKGKYFGKYIFWEAMWNIKHPWFIYSRFSFVTYLDRWSWCTDQTVFGFVPQCLIGGQTWQYLPTFAYQNSYVKGQVMI